VRYKRRSSTNENPVSYRLLDAFRQTFEGKRYLHRNSTLGDFIATHLCEDLYALGKSPRLVARIADRERVVNTRNRRRGIRARRGDGTFGEIVPGAVAVEDPRFTVARGQVATVEIGVEVKILAKAMIKQIDRVKNDLENQIRQFKKGAGEPICVGIVGINHARSCTGYEGTKVTPTDGRNNRHPYQEAPEAEARLMQQVAPKFDEFLVLRYKATNVEPYPFEWVNLKATELDYGAALTRISREYSRRFANGKFSHGD
jgi:hypothetical protein